MAKGKISSILGFIILAAIVMAGFVVNSKISREIQEIGAVPSLPDTVQTAPAAAPSQISLTTPVLSTPAVSTESLHSPSQTSSKDTLDLDDQEIIYEIPLDDVILVQ